MADIREVIDTLDREIIGLIGRRSGYVRAAAKFKTDETDVRAPERQRTMLGERRRWAEEEGLSPDLIEKVYHNLVSYFVNRELNDWRACDRTPLPIIIPNKQLSKRREDVTSETTA